MSIEKPKSGKSPPNRWKHRRRIVYGSLTFCAVSLSYLMVWGDDTALHREIANTIGLGALGVIATYLGGAVADDKFKKDSEDA